MCIFYSHYYPIIIPLLSRYYYPIIIIPLLLSHYYYPIIIIPLLSHYYPIIFPLLSHYYPILTITIRCSIDIFLGISHSTRRLGGVLSVEVASATRCCVGHKKTYATMGGSWDIQCIYLSIYIYN